MLFPIGDDNYGRRTKPIVVYTIVALNVVVFLFFQHAGARSGDPFTYGYSAVPYEITHNVDLVSPRRLQRVGDIPHSPGPSPIYLTLLVSMFMHGGWMHIIGNMLYLWIFGDNIEDNFGKVRFVVFYLACGIAASFAQIVLDVDSVIPTLGASGAIAGVLGSYLLMFPRNRVRALLPLGFLWTTVEVPAVVVLGLWIVTQIIAQYTAFAMTSLSHGGGIAYMAHIGGFFAGAGLTFLFRRRRRTYRYDDDYQ
jgi:membrane associated rhomboid family serine protease